MTPTVILVHESQLCRLWRRNLINRGQFAAQSKSWAKRSILSASLYNSLVHISLRLYMQPGKKLPLTNSEEDLNHKPKLPDQTCGSLYLG